MNSKNYCELIQIPDFEERKKYLYIGGGIGYETFGYSRELNQIFYKSSEWQSIRRQIILRDNGCDLGCPNYPILGRVLIHHIIPITKEDIINRADILLDPNNLISVSLDTHNYIHYGTIYRQEPLFHERKPFDTCPWKEAEGNGII